MTLQEIWNNLNSQGKGSDKNSVHSYLEIYSEILEPYRLTAKNVLEIGIFAGHSLRMWEQYFSNSEVYGIDCDIKPHGGLADLTELINEGTHNIIIMDATDPIQVERRFKNIQFDFICEDASHSPIQQKELFDLYKNYMAKGGLYVVEDLESIDTANEIYSYISRTNKAKIIDNRHVKNRFDDILIIVYF